MAKRQIAFRGARTRTLSEGYPSRGIYQITVTGTDSEDNYDLIRGESVACYVPQPDGSGALVQDPNAVGREIRIGLTMPDGKNENWDEMREGEIKGALLAIGVYGQHAQQQGVPLQTFLDRMEGQLEWDVEWFQGQTLFVVFDPPPLNAPRDDKGRLPLPETRLIVGGPNGGPQNAQAEFQAIATGKKKVTWPFDAKLAKAQAKQAAGGQPTGAGSMLGPAGAPPAPPGAPSGLPATPSAPGGFQTAAPQGGFQGGAPQGGAPTPTLPGAHATTAPAAPAGPTNGLSPMPGAPNAGGAPMPGAPGAFGPPPGQA